MHALAKLIRLGIIAMPVLFVTSQANSQAQSSSTAAELAAEIETLKREYEARIKALETKLSTLGAKSQPAARTAETPARTVRKTFDNVFNPSIGVVLNGIYTEFSAEESEIPGFQLGHESERPAEGLGLDHPEITVSSNIDDKFYGQLTLGLGTHPNEPTEVELEEAYIQTLPGAGLPDGFRIKAGRALWTLGYLNEQHTHSDDFSDRPLPYRVFLDNSYNDDGIEASFVLPTDLYSEIGGGLFRGDDTPFAGSDSGTEAWSAFARIGGDIGRNSAWRIGGYFLDGSAHERGGGHDHGHGNGHADEDAMHEEGHHEDHDEEHGHEDHFANADFFSEGAFTGDSRLYGFDVRYTWAPTGNPWESELILQGEYFWVEEKGRYAIQEEAHLDCATEPHGDHFDTNCESHTPEAEVLNVDAMSRGWYTQAVYKFLPSWRVGARYARLHPSSGAELDHDPYTVSAMADWTNSEFGRIRLQYNRESLSDHEDDDQIILQYIMSLGAHAAHTF